MAASRAIVIAAKAGTQGYHNPVPGFRENRPQADIFTGGSRSLGSGQT